MEVGEGPQTSKWIKLKVAYEVEIHLLNGKVDYLASWQEIQSKSSLLIGPNWPLDTRVWRRQVAVCSKRLCQVLREWVDVIEVADGIVEGMQKGM